MAAEFDNADALVLYLTGASEAGATQRDPSASLGGYWANSRAESITVATRTQPIPNIVIEYVSGNCGPGLAKLTAASSDSLTFRAPGATSAGSPVTVANGATVVIEAADTDYYIIVRRTDSNALAGAETLQLVDTYGNLIGGSDFVTADLSTGEDRSRAGAPFNKSATGITNLKISAAVIGNASAVSGTYASSGAVTVTLPTDGAKGWPAWGTVENTDSGEILFYTSRTDSALTVPAAGRAALGSTIAAGSDEDVLKPISAMYWGLEALSSGAVQEPASETTTPSSITWKAGTTQVNHGSLAAGAGTGLWFRREIIAGTSATAYALAALDYEYTLGSDTYTGQWRGLYGCQDTALARYEVFVDPTIDDAGNPTGTPDETFTGSTHTTTLTLDTDAISDFRVFERNKYGLYSEGDATLFDIDSGGSENATKPSAPQHITITPQASGEARITAAYFPYKDLAAPATKFMVYATNDGTTPDPDSDTAITEVAFTAARGVVNLDYTTEFGDTVDGATIKVKITVAYEIGGSDIQSADRTLYSAIAEYHGPDSPNTEITQRKVFGFAHSPATAPSAKVYIDEGNNIFWQPGANTMQLWADTVLIWNLEYDGGNTTRQRLRTPFGFDANDYSGVASGTDGIEVGTWNGSQKDLYITVGGARVAHIDVINEVIHAGAQNRVVAPATTRADLPIWETVDAAIFQVWDSSVEKYISAMSVDSDGVFYTQKIGWRKMANQAACLT